MPQSSQDNSSTVIFSVPIAVNPNTPMPSASTGGTDSETYPSIDIEYSEEADDEQSETSSGDSISEQPQSLTDVDRGGHGLEEEYISEDEYRQPDAKHISPYLQRQIQQDAFQTKIYLDIEQIDKKLLNILFKKAGDNINDSGEKQDPRHENKYHEFQLKDFNRDKERIWNKDYQVNKEDQSFYITKDSKKKVQVSLMQEPLRKQFKLIISKEGDDSDSIDLMLSIALDAKKKLGSKAKMTIYVVEPPHTTQYRQDLLAIMGKAKPLGLAITLAAPVGINDSMKLKSVEEAIEEIHRDLKLPINQYKVDDKLKVILGYIPEGKSSVRSPENGEIKAKREQVKELSAEQRIKHLQELKSLVAETKELPVKHRKYDMVSGDISTYRNEQEITSAFKHQAGDDFIHQSIHGDGHCLYNAVALYCGEDQQTLRHIVAAHIRTNLDEYQDLIESLEVCNGRTVEEYLRDIEAGKEWADNLEIAVLMKILSRPIIILEPNNKIRNLSNVEDDNGLMFPGDPIFVYYNGCDHYDALIRRDANIRGIDIFNKLKQKEINRRNLGQANISPNSLISAETLPFNSRQNT